MSEPGKVLVVDDDRNLTFVLRAHLTNAGFSVEVCHDGQTGLDNARRTLPDVIVLDLQMPRMDGLEVTRALRDDESTHKIPVIILTGRGSPNDIVLGLDAGAQDYVVKPFDVAELTARVRSMHKLSQVQKQIDEANDRLSHEVKDKTARLELLYGFTRALNHANSVNEIYDLVIGAIQKATGCRRISIMVHDPITGKLKCQRAIGMAPEVVDQVNVNTDSGIAGQVFTTGTTMVATAVNRGPERDYDGNSFMSTPLVSTCMVSGEQRMGVLNVTEKPGHEPFTEEEVGCIRSIADSAAIALHNEERRSGLTKSLRALLLTVGRLSEYRDEETGEHLSRVQAYAHALLTEMATLSKYQAVITPEFFENLHQAAPLHDIGKVGIPDEILNKPGKLTDEEFEIMRTHTNIGQHTLELAIEEAGPVPLLQMCLDIAYSHHERWDGQGYPQGLSGEDIPLSARIITLVDAYDAITTARCYKKALPHSRAVEIICNDSGSHFDPQIVEAFLSVQDEFDRIREEKADPPILEVVETKSAEESEDLVEAEVAPWPTGNAAIAGPPSRS